MPACHVEVVHAQVRDRLLCLVEEPDTVGDRKPGGDLVCFAADVLNTDDDGLLPAGTQLGSTGGQGADVEGRRPYGAVRQDEFTNTDRARAPAETQG